MIEKIREMKPSELLRLVILHGKNWEESEGKVFDMSTWGLDEEGVCYACLAGAVLHQEAPGLWDTYLTAHSGISPKSVDNVWMFAIDCLRWGSLNEACLAQAAVSREQNDKLLELEDKWETYYANYEKDGRLSWDDYEEMAVDLESIGL